MLYSFPVLLDWNNDGKTDLLLGYSTSNGIYPQTKQYRLYLNSGTNEEPKFSSPIQACDEKGEMLFIRGQWLQNYANQSGFSARDFDGDGRIDLIVEGQTNNELLFLRNVSPNPDGFVFAKPVHVMIGLNRFSYVQSNRFFQIVDIDGDGNLDLVNANGEDIQWFRGISKGAPQPSFAPSEAPVGAVLVATAAATLDAAKPENTSEQPAKILEARATAGGWGQKPKGDQKVFLVRFEGLPAVPVDAATLILCVDRKVQADPSLMVGPFDFQISSNLIDIDWDPATVSWSGPRKDVKWPEKFLDAGGTFQSFAPPALSVGNSTDFRWDITRAVHEAQKRKQTRLDILVRVDYTGHYLDRAGRMFCGPAWQEEGKRPRLILSTKEK
jgi:hypothetical protein